MMMMMMMMMMMLLLMNDDDHNHHKQTFGSLPIFVMHRCKALHFLHLPAFQLKDEISGKVPVQTLNKLSHVGDATSVPCNGFKSVLKNRQSGKAATPRKIGWTSFRQKNPIRTDFT